MLVIHEHYVLWPQIFCAIFAFCFAIALHRWLKRSLDNFLAMRKIRKSIRAQQRLWYS